MLGFFKLHNYVTTEENTAQNICARTHNPVFCTTCTQISLTKNKDNKDMNSVLRQKTQSQLQTSSKNEIYLSIGR